MYRVLAASSDTQRQRQAARMTIRGDSRLVELIFLSVPAVVAFEAEQPIIVLGPDGDT